MSADTPDGPAREVPETPEAPETTPAETTGEVTAQILPIGVAPSPPDEEPEASDTDEDEIDLDDPKYYLNRELTWLEFNWRVLNEARDERTPLLERVKFLSIVNSNLDEFFMKRIGGLKQQVGAGMHERTVDGRTPREQIAECLEVVARLEDQCLIALDELKELLREAGIILARVADLDKKQQETMRQWYVENVYPLVTPQSMDPAHPFPFVSNLSLNLLVTLQHPKDETPSLARVKIPIGLGIPRLVRVGDDNVFVCLEDVMAENLDLLFPGMEIGSCEVFRVTRNANTDRDEEEADDLLSMIQSELRERKLATIVRMQIADGMSNLHRGMLAAELDLDEDADVVKVAGMLGLKDLMELAGLDLPDLHDPRHRPVDSPDLARAGPIFHRIREQGSILLHHPYESFSTSVERFLEEASVDPKVRAIKMTLYRTSADTRVIDHLIDAARNGKQVAVVVELKARFDEDANIRWASRLEEFGIHVTYGVVGLKTHCKVILVLRQDYDGLRRYAHLGTGNYHAGTARLYTDLGLLTCDEQIGEDLTELFNYLTTGFKPKRKYQKLLPAPTVMKAAFLAKIEREIEHAQNGREALIQVKLNAIEDADMSRALYRAGMNGVKVDLIVRDTCRVRPGLPNLSENVRVVSLVGRFLEHARIIFFNNDGNPEFYIGSADWMKRNLESRVEVMTPVEDPRHQKELRTIIDLQLRDQRNGWDMQSDGRYVQRSGGDGRKERGAQILLTEHAEKRYKAAMRLRKRKPQGVARRDSS
jgi:polyphosphate kinase